MQTPPKIEFQNINPTQEIRDAIDKHIAELEQRWDRVTACRVVVKGPGQHHRVGGLYEIHIHLALPEGREVHVERTAPADERRSDLAFAVNDAFKRARRQLQDQRSPRAREGEKRITGRRSERWRGLIPPASSDSSRPATARKSIFTVTVSSARAIARLRVGSRVTFAEEMGDKGAQASTVKPLGKHALR